MSATPEERARAVMELAARRWATPYPFAKMSTHNIFEHAVTEAIRAAEAEAFERAKEMAARECDERSILNDAVEGEEDMATDVHTDVRATAGGHRAIEARCCAHAIRALRAEERDK